MSHAIEKVKFNGHDLDVIREGDDVWVSVIRVCEVLGIAAQAQQEKLATRVWSRTTLRVVEAKNKLRRETYMLHLDALAMWLATIDADKVKDSARAEVEEFQMNCAKALRDYFFPKPVLVAPPTSPLLNLDLASGPRMGAVPNTRRDISRECAMVASASDNSLAAIHGFIRRTYNVPGIYCLSVYAWPQVKETLRAIALREVFIRPRLPPPEDRQTKMFSH